MYTATKGYPKELKVPTIFSTLFTDWDGIIATLTKNVLYAIATY